MPEPRTSADNAAQQNNRGLEKWFPTRSKRGRGPVEGIRASDKHRNSALVPLGKCSGEC